MSNTKSKHNELVIVLDFGAQYGQLIARRVRECRVYCEILPFDTPVKKLIALKPKGIIFSGGPASVYEKHAPECDPALFTSGIPILGICYGMQLMGKLLGGKVVPAHKREFGKTELTVLSSADLFAGLNPQLICWMSHGDQVVEAPPGFTPLAQTHTAPIAAMGDRKRKLYGVQFHPEVIHTPWGIEVFRNFLSQIAGCQGLWTMSSVAEQATENIREEVGKKRVICALSGGVDSCTVAAIVHRAIGDKLTCIFVDHGFLRKNEGKQVLKALKENFRVNLVFNNASKRFLELLKGITDPEQKRIRIGNEFIAVFEEEAKKIGRVSYLAQGTLYPDVIESGTRTAAGIKSHHNVGGLPERMNLKLIEPLRSLFKDEVRRLAEEVGLPAEIAWRQPFPGPGLAIRIMGEITKERLDILREADAVTLDEIRKAGLYRNLFQSFAVLAPSLRSVGVMGDQRTYAYTLIIRAVTGDDAMTADWARLPYEVLERLSTRIINEVKGINRVVYDISSKPPATIEWE